MWWIKSSFQIPKSHCGNKPNCQCNVSCRKPWQGVIIWREQGVQNAINRQDIRKGWIVNSDIKDVEEYINPVFNHWIRFQIVNQIEF